MKIEKMAVFRTYLTKLKGGVIAKSSFFIIKTFIIAKKRKVSWLKTNKSL